MSTKSDQDQTAAAGRGARLVRDDGEERFDVQPLLVATDGAIAAFGYDRRRLRPNLVIRGVDGLSEREWEGRTLQIGAALLVREPVGLPLRGLFPVGMRLHLR